MFLGDFPEDYTTVTCMFVTYDSSGVATAPSTPLDVADIFIYKNGNQAQKTTANGLTLSSPFDATVGVHCLVIDTANDTGDIGFWTPGSTYTIVLWADDETVGGTKPVKVLGQFTIGIIADSVWDEPKSFHNFADTMGAQVRTSADAAFWVNNNLLASGTAQAGASNSITLAVGSSSVTDQFKNNLIIVYSGTGSGQARAIVSYNGTTKAATIEPAWGTNPDGTSLYMVVAASTLTTVQINNEVTDVLNVDTFAEPGQGAPAATASLATKIGFLYKAWRNRHTQSSSTYTLYADDASTADQTAATADNGTQFSRSEITGP